MTIESSKGSSCPARSLTSHPKPCSIAVVELGANSPAKSFVSAIEPEYVTAFGIVNSTPKLDPAVRATVRSIREVSQAPILIGGVAIPNEQSALALGSYRVLIVTARRHRMAQRFASRAAPHRHVSGPER